MYVQKALKKKLISFLKNIKIKKAHNFKILLKKKLQSIFFYDFYVKKS